MGYDVMITRKAERKLQRLPRDVQKRMTAAMEDLSHDPQPPESRQLKGQLEGYRRLRIGRSHRLMYEVDHDERKVTVVNVGSREGIY